MKSKFLLSLISLLLISIIFLPQVFNNENKIENQIPLKTTTCSDKSTFIGNPAAYYCNNVMGYEYEITAQLDGSQTGHCIMPDGETCDQWEFYSGECGADYSFCASGGMGIETRYDGNDPYAVRYGVCIDTESRSEIKISNLIDFETTLEELQEDKSPSRSGIIPELNDEIRSSLPPHFDWRDIEGVNWITPIKNQAACGSCWAFSAVGVIESYYNLINDDPNLDLDLSEENLVSDCVMYGCDGGHSWSSLEYTRDVGIVNEACMPYTATDSACAGMCSDPTRYTVDQIIWEYYEMDVDLLKYFVVNYGPISVYLHMGGSFNELDVFTCDPLPQGYINHAVVIVGYDEIGQYWIVKNSWGSSWNENGFFKVGFNECNIDSTLYAFLPRDVYKTFMPMVTKPGRSFTTTPNLISPTEGEIIHTLKPTLTWEFDSSLHEATYIYYQISPDYNLHEYSGGINDWGWVGSGSITVYQNLKPGTTYYWHAAYDYLNEQNSWVVGPYCEPMTFTTSSDGHIPEKTILLSPEDEAALDDTDVLLDWQPVPYADYYEVMLMWEEYYEPYWYMVGYRLSTTVDQISVADYVEPNKQYFWRVRAVNDYAWGDYSNDRTFTTGDPASYNKLPDKNLDLPLFIQLQNGEFLPFEQFAEKNP